MTRNCGCSGNCGGEVNRREFLQLVLTGTAGWALSRTLPADAQQDTPPVWQVTRRSLPQPFRARTYPIQSPRTYTGANLEYVLMPIGGIGTGTVWLDGQGRLAVWQIFNNFTEERLQNAVFALRIGNDLRVLQTVPEQNVSGLPSLSYEGGYPIARLRFDTGDLPVEIMLEAFNPFIPLDAFHSALPCAIFRWTVRNRTRRSVSLSLLATLPESAPVGTTLRCAPGSPESLAWRDYPPPGSLKLRTEQEDEVSSPPLFWLPSLGPLHSASAAKADSLALLTGAAQTLRAGGVVLITSPSHLFWSSDRVPWQVFEDFEKDSYEGWTVEGTAFGTAPHTGTTPGQQLVSGFWGNRLVNTYLPNDEPQGTLTSRKFPIFNRYIGFLIGGGNHPGETCINLLVDGKVVRTATGYNNERLVPQQWDVSEFRGKWAQIQIVDRHSGGWGHINVDHIVFSNLPPVALFSAVESQQYLQKALVIPCEQMRLEGKRSKAEWTEAGRRLAGGLDISQWEVLALLKLVGFQPGEWQVLAQTPEGDPLLMSKQVGNGTVLMCLAQSIPASWMPILLARLGGVAADQPLKLVSGHPRWGEVVLATDHAQPRFQRWQNLSDLRQEGTSIGTHSAMDVPLRLRPGQAQSVSFVLGWYYPNVERFGHRGNLYARWFRNAHEVTQYVLKNLPALWSWTRLYHQTMYQSNLPPLMLDAITSQAVILRAPTCFWSADGYFGGFEGSYGCCPLNCTHVWNYAQTHARLFPEIGRNMRESDLLVYLHPTGETSHRQHAPHNAFIDGHCATICAAYREHLTSPDTEFLRKVWRRVKLATDWLIQAIDADEDGVPSGHQWNTYDTALSGANTFIGSQYLCALASAERMAMLMGDSVSARRYRRIRTAGMSNQDAQLWNGEYYIQKPGVPPAHDYNTGCHSDQLLGQWWAHQLGLGYLYPREKVRRALQSIFRYNFRTNMHGHTQIPRRYVLDDEGGLLMCSWPKGGRPDPFILYADEVWTGIEYATAGLMLWEGMVDEAVQIVNTARGRYDGRRRDGLDSGPGGNPFNELECGKFYARAMSSFGLMLAAQGLILDTPAGVLGFAPRWKPEDHRSFFVTGTGWGLFVQKRERGQQREEIDLRYGTLRLQQMVFHLPEGANLKRCRVQISGRAVEASAQMEEGRVVVRLAEQENVTAPAQIVVQLRYG